MKKNILFIINPIAGGRSKSGFPELASRYLDPTKFEAQYLFSQDIGHARELSAEAIAQGVDIVVAVGGDGTINEVASALLESGTTMGIIPCGSGNGLARALGIPLKNRKALNRLNRMQEVYIDSGLFNGKNFFNMAGIGFDAHISMRFALDATRGLKGYIRTTLSEIAQYQPEQYTIEIDGQVYHREAFMISIANSSQFGNNAHVSPFASLNDGLLDVCIIKPFPLYHFPVMGFHMFSKTAHKSKFVEIIKGREIRIIRTKEGAVHLDGEPQMMGAEINISIKPLSLSVLT